VCAIHQPKGRIFFFFNSQESEYGQGFDSPSKKDIFRKLFAYFKVLLYTIFFPSLS
jgi:hypothetical protein